MPDKKALTFVVNDDSAVNSFGFRVLTEGIDISYFEQNPTMLYLHLRGFSNMSDGDPLLPIGRWVNVRKEGSKLLADAEFDLDDPFAAKVASKVEKKIINATSLGADVVELSEDPALMLQGQQYPTVTKSILTEISIADIPSNRKCVRLNHKGHTITLSDRSQQEDLSKIFLTNKKPNEASMKSLIALLMSIPGANITLSDNATESEVIGAVNKVLANHKLELSQKDTMITELTNQVNTLKTEKQNAETQAREDKAITLVDAAGPNGSKKITAAQRDHYIKLAKIDFEATKAIIDSLPAFKSVSSQITGDGSEGDGDDKIKLVAKYDELHKSGGLYNLKMSNPEQYAKLHEAKFGKKPK